MADTKGGVDVSKRVQFVIENTDTKVLRVVYGLNGNLEEVMVQPGARQDITADDNWRVEVTALGVQGEHAPDIESPYTPGG